MACASRRIVLPLIKAMKAGLDVSIDKLEAHYLAGGNVDPGRRRAYRGAPGAD